MGVLSGKRVGRVDLSLGHAGVIALGPRGTCYIANAHAMLEHMPINV